MRVPLGAAALVGLSLSGLHGRPGFLWGAFACLALLVLWEVYESECRHREQADAHARTLALARVKSPAMQQVEALTTQVEELQSQVTALRLNRGMQ